MTAEDIARALGGKRYGRQWLCRCPAHDDHNPSLLIFDGHTKVQFRCLAGCDPVDIIEALRERGLWGGADPWNIDADAIGPRVDPTSVDPHRKHKLAMRIWHEALDPRGTIAEIYLRGRGLVLPASCALSVVRYHPRCPKSGDFAPALVVLMRNVETFEPQAIQRIYLEEDPITGIVRKTGAMMLGPVGNAAMMLTSRFDTFWDDLSFCPQLAVSEGFETDLSLLMRGHRCVWALGSAGAIARFPVIFGVGELLICADHDENGTSQRAAAECAKRWNATTHQRARIVMPSQEGTDFADIYRSGADHG